MQHDKDFNDTFQQPHIWNGIIPRTVFPSEVNCDLSMDSKSHPMVYEGM